MKRENYIWLAAFAVFVFFCFFLRSEMERNRAQMATDVHDEIGKAPVSILKSVSDSVEKAATGNSQSTNAANGHVTESGGIFGDITRVIQKTVGSPDSSNSPNNANTNSASDLEKLGVRVLDTAAQTARKIDRVGLDATRMSDAQESELGAEMAESITNQFDLVPESPEYARIARLMAPILDARKRQQIHYTFHIVDSKKVNAFSLAGGYIYITTEFLHVFPADASLVMALSHEIGHVDLGHCAEKVQYVRLGNQVVGKAADLGGVVYNALATPYTKDQEFDADKYGFMASRKAGWNASELIALFAQLDAYEQREGTASNPKESILATKLKNYFSSHPPTSERKQRLENLDSAKR